MQVSFRPIYFTQKHVRNDSIMAVGSGRSMEDDARIAWTELISWIVEYYGFEKLEAYRLLT